MSSFENDLGVPPAQGQPHFQGEGKLRLSRGSRELFPLPVPPEVCQLQPLSRRCQQRLDRKRRLGCDVRDAVKGLNWLHGFSPFDEFVDSPDAMQEEVLGRIHYLCKMASEMGSFDQQLAPEAALLELLQGKTEYHAQQSPVAGALRP